MDRILVLIEQYGYLIVFLVVMLESAGVLEKRWWELVPNSGSSTTRGLKVDSKPRLAQSPWSK